VVFQAEIGKLFSFLRKLGPFLLLTGLTWTSMMKIVAHGSSGSPIGRGKKTRILNCILVLGQILRTLVCFVPVALYPLT
jgi:hypothetical protein